MDAILEKSWESILQRELELPYMKKLKEFLNGEVLEGKEVYPPMGEVFSALEQTPFEKVKVVIMGQDPYHGPLQAMGLSFSVRQDKTLPPSLKNIFKELVEDVNIPYPQHGSLLSWAKQGVLLLNATLTVRKGEANSHQGRGWEIFTDKIIEKLCDRESPIVFILWGKSAQKKCDRILSKKEHPHVVLKSSHPSPFSVKSFYGSKPFSKANSWLEKWEKKPIDWRIS